jgi:hypothetical protein
LRYVPDGSLYTASVEQIFPRDGVQRNCFELALYTTRDHDGISNCIGSGIRCRKRGHSLSELLSLAFSMGSERHFPNFLKDVPEFWLRR